MPSYLQTQFGDGSLTNGVTPAPCTGPSRRADTHHPSPARNPMAQPADPRPPLQHHDPKITWGDPPAPNPPSPRRGEGGTLRGETPAPPSHAGRAGQRREEWPAGAAPINSPRRGGGGRSRRSRRCRRCRRRCRRRAGRGQSQHRGQRPLRAPLPRPLRAPLRAPLHHHDGGEPPAGRGDLGRPVLRDLAPLRLRR